MADIIFWKANDFRGTLYSKGFEVVDYEFDIGFSEFKMAGLVFAKPTVIPTMGYGIQRLERVWFSRNQPSAFLYEGWNTVDFP